MYTTTRFYYPHGIEGEPMETTVKEFETIEEAKKYAHRYAKGHRFASVEIENEEGKIIYELLADGQIFDETEAEITQEVEKAKQLVENILKNTYDIHNESKEDKQCFTRQELQQEYLEQILIGDKDSLLDWLEFIGQKDLYREVANF